MPSPLPALNLIATPGRRHATLEMAREIERRGFAGISVSSSFANMAQCTGVAHGPSHVRMGITPGKPLADIRAFVARFKSYDNIGGLPPVILATLRKRMIALSGEIAEGLVFSGGSRAHMADS